MFITSCTLSQSQNPCDCNRVFKNLVQKIEEDYIGYALTKDDIITGYQSLIKEYDALTKNVSTISCIPLLQRFLEFFKDEHLFVTQIPNYNEAELTDFKKEVKEKMYDINDIRSLLEKKASPGNLEGFWTDGESEYALFKNQNVYWDYEYVGVILNHSDHGKIGELKLGVTLKDGHYEGVYYANNYAPAYTKIDLVKENSQLNIWGGRIWGRIHNDEDFITNGKVPNPKIPTVSVLDAETILLSIPTFLINKSEFDKVIEANSKSIKESKYLVIDIRGNSGGNGIYFDLLKLFADRSATSEQGLALASADNIGYFEKFGNRPVYAPVVKAMKEGMGKIVDGPHYGTLKLKPTKTNIEKVAIVTDESNMSAAESFILHAKGVSSKVITIGKNTKGVIDYQSINMVKLNCEIEGIYFGYPTSTSTKDVPKKGYNKTGIPPDVLTEKSGKELIDYVKNILKK